MNKTLSFFALLLLSYHICFSQNKGQEKMDSLFSVLKTEKDDTSKVITLNNLVREFRRDNPDTAVYFADKAIILATKLNYASGIAEALILKAIALNYLGRYREALENADKSLQIIDQQLKNGDAADFKILNMKARALGIIGNINDDQGNYAESLKNNLEAIKIVEVTGDQASMALSYNNIGNIYAEIGNYPEALKNQFASLRIKEKENFDKKSIANSYNNIGSTLYNNGELDQALKYNFIALKIREEIGDKYGKASSYSNIGNIYSEQGNYQEALKYLFAGLKIQEEIGDKNGTALSRDNLGLVFMNQKNYEEALRYFFDYLKISEEIEDKSGIANAKINIGSVYAKQGRNADASIYLDKGLMLAKEIGSLDMIKEAYDIMAKVDSSQGNFKQAFTHHKLYMLYRDSIFNEENTKKLVQAQMQYEFDKKESLSKAAQEKKDEIALKEIQKQKLVRNGFIGGFSVVLLFASIFLIQRNKISREKKISEAERKRNEELLLNILPAEVAEELKKTGHCQAKTFSMVTVMFADFKDFTSVSEKVSAELLVGELNFCFSHFDNILSTHKIEKIKTVGDAYMCVSGLPTLNYTHAYDVVTAAIEMNKFIQSRKREKEGKGEIAFELRIGIHTGPVVAGIVGIKKFSYDIWGDTVNIASRMESSSEAGKINISGSTYELVKEKFNCIHRGKIAAKNKGEIDMYFVNEIS